MPRSCLEGRAAPVEVADLLLIDEADQAYLRDSTKEYASGGGEIQARKRCAAA
jgi:hypothetical protein